MSITFLRKSEHIMQIYVVKSGDTLYSIAQNYGVSYRRLMFYNGIFNPKKLVVGQSLLILEPEVIYTAVKGDTLYSIADKFNTTVLELRRNNPYITDSYYVSDGEKIVISYKSETRKKAKLSGFVYSYVNRRLLCHI